MLKQTDVSGFDRCVRFSVLVHQLRSAPLRITLWMCCGFNILQYLDGTISTELERRMCRFVARSASTFPFHLVFSIKAHFGFALGAEFRRTCFLCAAFILLTEFLECVDFASSPFHISDLAWESVVNFGSCAHVVWRVVVLWCILWPVRV